MSADGSTVVFVEHVAAPRCGEDRIVVVRSGVRTTISRPLAFLYLQKYHFGTWVSAVAIGDDGSLFATVSVHFSGAYIGTKRETFVRKPSGWKQITGSYLKKVCCPDNVSIGAVRTLDKYVVNVDYDDTHPVAGSMFEADASLFAPESYAIRRDIASRLALGTVESARGSWSAGYTSGYQHSTALPLRATRWNGTSVNDLGPGVAFGVDGSGDAVGDDRDSWSVNGCPTIWKNKRATIFSPAPGSAFAIRNGIVVGTLNQHAFTFRPFEPGARPVMLQVPGRSVQSQALDVSASGKVLVLAKGPKTVSYLLILQSS